MSIRSLFLLLFTTLILLLGSIFYVMSLVVTNQDEAEAEAEAEETIRTVLTRVAQLNADHPCSYSLEELTKMLGEALAAQQAQ